MDRVEALTALLYALDEWGCEAHSDRASAIIDFIDSGYDLSRYEDKPTLRVIDGGKGDAE